MSQLRIIGGQWRSRRLLVAEVPGLRPTPDRVRETLFNWLGQDMEGWSCLDLFAGSGALGFEAASRGAEHVCFVEQNATAFAVLQQNARLLGGSAMVCQRGDALRFIEGNRRRYDLVFVDPPFRQQWLEKLAPVLERLLNDGGLVYVEAEAPVSELGGLRAIKSGKAGQVYYQLLQGGAA